MLKILFALLIIVTSILFVIIIHNYVCKINLIYLKTKINIFIIGLTINGLLLLIFNIIKTQKKVLETIIKIYKFSLPIIGVTFFTCIIIAGINTIKKLNKEVILYIIKQILINIFIYCIIIIPIFLIINNINNDEKQDLITDFINNISLFGITLKNKNYTITNSIFFSTGKIMLFVKLIQYIFYIKNNNQILFINNSNDNKKNTNKHKIIFNTIIAIIMTTILCLCLSSIIHEKINKLSIMFIVKILIIIFCLCCFNIKNNDTYFLNINIDNNIYLLIKNYASYINISIISFFQE